MIQERLAAAGAGVGPLGFVISLVDNLTSALQVLVLIATLFATTMSGIYYYRKNYGRKQDDNKGKVRDSE